MSHDEQGIVDQFGTELATASDKIAETWKLVEALQRTGDDLEDTYTDALTQAADDLEHLEQVDTVSREVLDQATSLTTRVIAVESVLKTLLRYHTLKLEWIVGRYRCWFDSLSNLVETGNLSDDTLLSQCNELQKSFGLAENSFSDGKHIKLLSFDQFSIEDIESHLRTVDEAIQSTLSPDRYIEYCCDVGETLNDRIVTNLRSLSEANPKQTKYGSSLREHRSTFSALKDDISEDAPLTDSDVEDAWTALEAYLTIANETAHHRAAQRTAQELVSVIDSLDQFVDVDTDVISSHAAEGRLDDVRSRIADDLQDDITITDEQRFARLLREYDGSLDVVIERSGFSVDEAFDFLQSLYDVGTVTNASIEFKS